MVDLNRGTERPETWAPNELFWQISVLKENLARVPTGLENQGESGKMLNKIPGLENSGNLKMSCFYQ